MSLIKLPVTRQIPGQPAQAAQAYSKTCPQAGASGSPSSSGGVTGCQQVPIWGYQFVATSGSQSSLGSSGSSYTNGGYYEYTIIGYKEVCYA